LLGEPALTRPAAPALHHPPVTTDQVTQWIEFSRVVERRGVGEAPLHAIEVMVAQKVCEHARFLERDIEHYEAGIGLLRLQL
jgi:hypothetical protein